MADPSRENSARDFYLACAVSLFVHVLIFFPDRFLYVPVEVGMSGRVVPLSAVLVKPGGSKVLPLLNTGESRTEGKSSLRHEPPGSRSVAMVFPQKEVSTVALVPSPKYRLTQPAVAQVEAASTVSENELAASSHVALYRLSLARAARGLAGYPSLAKKNGWEGVVVLNIQGVAGRLVPYVSVGQSSGSGLLDDHAREVMLRAASQVQMPDALSSRSFTVVVPVEYRLVD